MKGEEYVDQHQQQHHNNLQSKHETTTTPMFPKLHPHPHHLPFSHHFHLSPHSDDFDDSAAASSAHKLKLTPDQPITSVATDGATIEVIRRPRGRPPGSKNKPKPPVIITRDPEPAMSPYILEVPGGNDVVEAISRFCSRRNMGVCVLTGSGTVSNVTLRQPSTTTGATVTFHGRFDILSISATFFPQTASCPVPNSFTISLAGPQCQIVGGSVAGRLVAAGTVFVIAASFNNPNYHRISADDEGGNSGSGGGGEGQSPAVSGGESGHTQGGPEPLAMYSCHMPSDVIWAPTARPPPPY